MLFIMGMLRRRGCGRCCLSRQPPLFFRTTKHERTSSRESESGMRSLGRQGSIGIVGDGAHGVAKTAISEIRGSLRGKTIYVDRM
jgi:hypothetical protein